MSDGNPPDSWYDPPEPKFDFEIKSEEKPGPLDVCERNGCEEEAYMTVGIGDVRDRMTDGHIITVCKNHYDSVIEDEIKEAEDYEPDYDED